MKVVDKQMLFVSSSERDSGSASDFHLSMPSHLLTCQPHQRLRLVLNDVVLPYTFYNVQESNRSFQVVQNGGAPVTVQMTEGSYHALQLRDHLADVLSAVSVGVSYTVTFHEKTSVFEFSITGASGVNSLSFQGTAAHKLLGFEKGSTNLFSLTKLTSSKAVSMMLTDALYLHCDMQNTNVDKGAGTNETFNLSSTFAKIMVNTSPFNNIIFVNANDDYMLNLSDKRIHGLRFWVTTTDHDPVSLNDDFSFTLKVEVIEDDEKIMKTQNAALGELLRLLVLQNHVNRNDPK